MCNLSSYHHLPAPRVLHFSAFILNIVLVSARLATISSLGSRAACNGEDITLTCNTFATGRLTWVIGPDTDTIVFSLSEDSESLSVTQHDSTGQFSASLTHFSRDQEYSFLGNLTSTLHTRVDSSTTHYPVTIYCNDGINISVPFFIRLASMHCFHYYVLIIKWLVSGPPSSLLNTTTEVVYGVSEYSLRVQWKPHRDDGGVCIDNYTLFLYSDHLILSQTATTDSLELTLTLNYSTNYSIIITASNCAGSSSLSFNIAEGQTKTFCAL